MKHLKKYKSFLEDGTATVTATTAGMGAVVNSQPGDLPGTTGTKGSGDITSYLNGGSANYATYGFVTPGPFISSGSSASSVGASLDGSSQPIIGTCFNGKIGAVHVYSGLLENAQMADIVTKTYTIY